MKPIKLDFSKFKHVKSDDKTTTLKHADGHEITLAHSALSKDAQKQLGALKGLAADAKTPAQAGEERQAKQVAANPQSRENKDFGDIKAVPGAEPKTGKVIMKAEGGDVTKPKDQAAPNAPTPGCKVIRSDKGYGSIIMCDAEGGKVEKPHVEGAKFCAHCGGPAMYAHGGMAERGDEEAPANMPEDKKPEALSPTEQTYNDTALSRMVNKPDYVDMGMNNPVDLIKEHGVAPEHPDQSALRHAVVQDEWKATNEAADASKNAEEAKINADLMSRMGLKSPEASPDVSGANQEAQATNAMPQGSGEMPAPAPSTSGGGLPGDPEGAYMAGMANKLQGVQQQAQAQGDLGKVQADKLNKMVEAEHQATEAYNTHFNELEQERMAHMQDIQNGHIDPNKYWTGDEHGNGGHSKIAAGIGMILAGFNPTSNPNAAIDFLKKQMDMNLRAQERNLSSKETLLSANLRQFGNLKDATDMTRIMQHDTIANELQSAAATAQSPLAKAAAMQAAGQIKMEAAPMMQNFAMRRAMLALAGGQHGDADPDKLEHQIAMISTLNPEQGKVYREAFVPGVGLSKSLQPIPQAVREELISHEKLQNMGEDILKYSKTHTNLIPGTKEYNIGVQKAAILQQTVREGLLGTVFRESEKPLLNKLVQDNPAGALKTINSDPKIRTLLESNKMQADTLKKSYGLPTKTSSSGAEPQYKTVNGVKYMRGPNGEAIPVK